MTRTTRDYLLIVITGALGNLSLLMMLVFIFNGSLDMVKLNVGQISAFLINSFLSIAFFVQHSLMVRESFKRWSNPIIEGKYNGVVFSLVSSLVLMLVLILWQKSSFVIFTACGGLRWLFRLIFALALSGFFWGARSLGSRDTFGIERMRRNIEGKTTKPARLFIRGPYRWIRHPLYFFCIIMIWACPDLTADRLLFNVLWTLWIIIGVILEERDLVSQFGSDYVGYQRDVPILFPVKIPTGGKSNL